jgi:hypothetical protein
MATTADEYNPTTVKRYRYKGEVITVTKIDGGIFYGFAGWDNFWGYTKDLNKLTNTPDKILDDEATLAHYNNELLTRDKE